MKLTVKPLVLAVLMASILPAAQAAETSAPEQAAQQQTASMKVIEQAVAKAVYELAYSSSQNEVFVMAPVFKKDLESGKKPQVVRLNGDTLKIEGATDLPSAGFGTVLDDDSHTLYIGSHNSTVIAYDTMANKVKGEVQLAGKETDKKTGKTNPTHFLRQLHLDAKNQRLYIPGLSFEGSVLYVVDTQTFKLIKTIENTGLMSTGITQAPDGGDIFLTNWQHEMVVVDSKKLDIKNRFSIPVDQPLFLAWNPERKEVLAVDEGLEKIYGMLKKDAQETGKTYQAKSEGNSLVVLDPQSGKVLRTISTGKQPVAVKVDDKAGRIYVTALEGGSVSVYSTKDYSLLNTVDVKPSANSIAINQKDGSVYISVKNFALKDKTEKEKVARLQF
ncbi:TPA: YncE family protein [Raoultella ornithinolytica]|nr:YncE family protein [Raoultella ornithinolytica]HAT1671192.1 YncE family protein [Raoultella ornithinolytica]